jgi:hypothetical protein
MSAVSSGRTVIGGTLGIVLGMLIGAAGAPGAAGAAGVGAGELGAVGFGFGAGFGLLPVCAAGEAFA